MRPHRLRARREPCGTTRPGRLRRRSGTACSLVADLLVAQVARKWAGLALPDNAPPNARYRPICPFCAKPLKTDARAGDQPYSRILFQSDASRDDVEGSDGDSENGGWSTASPGLTVQDATPPDTAERKNDPGDADGDAA